ncbi:MAG TPA: phosphoribosylanthranilate isomerase [Gammaproteobacteria bacterium]|nr:phosphoribosylanthranilate isomerase [Gammaproteobacteria bacterium]
MFVKICGLTTLDGVEAAIEAGADAVGFVFASPSPREVTPERAVELCAGVPARMKRVAVMRHPAAALVERVLGVFAPDWLQTDAADFAAIALPPGCAALPVLRTGADGTALATDPAPARVLLEGRAGGQGLLADWNEARELARGRELILAGGLTPANVADAIRAVRPWGVDVSSGVEQPRGKKDPVRIREFVARARAMEDV